jgi:hypothetical protein
LQVTERCGSAQRKWRIWREKEREETHGKVIRIKERRQEDRGREKLNRKRKQEEGKIEGRREKE